MMVAMPNRNHVMKALTVMVTVMGQTTMKSADLMEVTVVKRVQLMDGITIVMGMNVTALKPPLNLKIYGLQRNVKRRKRNVIP